MGEIFQVLEKEAQQTLMMLSEGIRISKGVVVKMNKRTVYFTEPDLEEMSLSRGGDTIYWLHKWNHCDQEDKILLCAYQ